MIPKRFEIATVLILLSPLSGGFGLWVIFQAGILLGSNGTSVSTVVETSAGVFFFVLAFPLFFDSLGVLGSRNSLEAERWLSWLGRWRPRCQDQQQGSGNQDAYRVYALAILLVIFLLAILLIPGIGEDRQFPLNQFYGLFGSLWYFYAFSTGIAGFLLIYERRPGGYLLSLILSMIALGTNVTDVLGLQPPSAPTFRTSILELAGLPFAIVLAYVSLKAIRTHVSE